MFQTTTFGPLLDTALSESNADSTPVGSSNHESPQMLEIRTSSNLLSFDAIGRLTNALEVRRTPPGHRLKNQSSMASNFTGSHGIAKHPVCKHSAWDFGRQYRKEHGWPTCLKHSRRTLENHRHLVWNGMDKRSTCGSYRPAFQPSIFVGGSSPDI